MDPSISNTTPMDPLNMTDSTPCTLRQSSLASLTSARSDRLPSCSLWRRRCSLAVALSSRFRRNLSLSVELHGEESVAQKFQHVCKFEVHVYLRFHSFNLNLYGLTYVRTQTNARILQCCHASVGLAQARPNYVTEIPTAIIAFQW